MNNEHLRTEVETFIIGCFMWCFLLMVAVTYLHIFWCPGSSVCFVCGHPQGWEPADGGEYHGPNHPTYPGLGDWPNN